jgi:MFS family permease
LIKPVASEGDTPSIVKNQSLRRVSMAQFLAIAAIYAIFFSSIALVEEKTHSSSQMGVMIFAVTLPGYIVGMLAGALVDQYDRRQSLVVGNLLCLTVCIGFVIATQWVDNLPGLLVSVYVSNFMLSALMQFTASARDSLIPNAVRANQLFAANSILQVALLAAQGIGTILLCPVLYRAGGAPAVGLASLPLFTLAAWAYGGLPKKPSKRGSRTSVHSLASLSGELRDGWQYITRNDSLGRVIGFMVLISSLILVFTTLLPGMASRVWGVPVEHTMYMALPGGMGFALGLWLVGRRGDLLEVQEWISLGLLTLGGGLALISLLRVLEGIFVLLYLLISAVTGVGFALVIISARTFVQEHSPDEIRGRVISTQLFLSNTASALPLPLMGGLADAIGFRRVFGLLALAVLGGGIVNLRQGRR